MSDESSHNESEPERGVRIDGLHPADEIMESFPNKPPMFGVSPEDGLPRQVVPTSVKLAQAPPLTLDNLICQADRTKFVTRDEHGEIDREFTPEQVKRWPSGAYYVTVEGEITLRVAVEPVRPACKYYARQHVDFPDDPDFRANLRLCTARRSDAGEFLSLRDMSVFACSLRDPRDPVSEALLDARDDELLTLAKKREDKFDLDQALTGDAASEPAPAGTVFRTTVED